MNALLKITIVTLNLLFCLIVQAAYLSDVPVTLTQPDGRVLNIFATGDEFYNWLHDENGYTIVQDQNNGYYCYAELVNDQLMPTDILPSVDDPEANGLAPDTNLPPAVIEQTIDYFIEDIEPSITKEDFLNRQAPVTLNNLVVYIRFAGQTEYTEKQSFYTDVFNNSGSGVNSVTNYFKEASYNKLNVNSTFYPANSGTVVLSYQDTYDRGYYIKQSPTNLIGYVETDRAERKKREHTLLANAINFVKANVPASLDLDFNTDGRVDNISFIIRGNNAGFGTNNILWSHRWGLTSSTEFINGKEVLDYFLQMEDQNRVGVICHEMMHVFGAPDLYHADPARTSIPVGLWDLMASNVVAPQHSNAYIKHKYCGWINNIPEITNSGTFTLNDLTNATNNCYKIPIANSDEYLMLEYRRKRGTFESTIPSSGLLIYRINETYWGNYRNGDEVPGGVSDEVYVFREGGSVNSKGNYLKANFAGNLGRGKFSHTTDPFCFLSDSSTCVVAIKNISNTGASTISFEVDFCDKDDVTYSNTTFFPLVTEAVNITTNNTVIINNNTNITFEASREVQLNNNFAVKQGGNFTARIIECGEQ